MENTAELLFDDEELIEEVEEPIDFKTARKGLFVKRRRSDQKSEKKQDLSEAAKKKKKKEEKKRLGSSIKTFRKAQYKILQEKRSNSV